MLILRIVISLQKSRLLFKKNWAFNSASKQISQLLHSERFVLKNKEKYLLDWTIY